MVSRASCVALGLVGMLVVGCGGRADPPTSTPDATSPDATSPDATTGATPSALDQYLLKSDEVPGLEPMSTPLTHSEDPFDLPEGGAEQLRRSGYVSTTYQPAAGARGAGVSSVLLFETDVGASDWMAYETSDEVIRHEIPGATISRFRVPAVPGAHGWTGPDRHGNAIGQVYWTQGRCMMLIGLEVEGPRVRRLSAGVEAIYERTGGTCPE